MLLPGGLPLLPGVHLFMGGALCLQGEGGRPLLMGGCLLVLRVACGLAIAGHGCPFYVGGFSVLRLFGLEDAFISSQFF